MIKILPKYLQFINDYEIDNILVVLQSIKSLIDLDFIDYYQNKVQLNKKYSPKKLKLQKI